MKRQSNIDLLRILAMLLIVSHHFVLYAFDITTLGFTFNSWILHLMMMGGKLGVNIMMLLSGYFYEKNLTFKPLKIVNTYSQLWTYSVGALIVLCLIGSVSLNFSSVMISIMPVTFEHWWFGSAYIIFLFLQPYITKGLVALSEKEHKSLCLIITFFWIIIPRIFDQVLFLTDLAWIICVYILGVYLKRIKFYEQKNWKHFLIISAIISFVNLCLGMFGVIPVYYGMCKPLIVILAITLISTFSNMPIKENKIITFFASANLGVYLIHDSFYTRKVLWTEFLRVQDFANSPYLILYAFCVVIGIYIICSLIDYLREKTIGKIVIKVYKRILRYVNLKKINLK